MNDKDKKIAQTAVAVAASASVLVGSLFNSPADLAQDPNGRAIDKAFQPVVEQVIDEADDDSDDKKNPENEGGGGSGSGDGNEASVPAEENTRTVKSVLRQSILKVPAAIRAAIGIPLWCAGWVIINTVTGIWTAVLSPVLSTVLGWILTAAVILITVTAAVKLAHPDLPLKKILSKHTILGTVCCVALLALADTALPFFWDRYEAFSRLIKLSGSTLIAILIAIPFFRKKKKIANTTAAQGS